MKYEDLGNLLNAKHPLVVDEFIEILKKIKNKDHHDTSDSSENDEKVRGILGDAPQGWAVSEYGDSALQKDIARLIEIIVREKAIRISYVEVAKKIPESGLLTSDPDVDDEVMAKYDLVSEVRNAFKKLYTEYEESPEPKTEIKKEAFVALFKLIEHTDLVVVQKIKFNQETADKVRSLEGQIQSYKELFRASKESVEDLELRLEDIKEDIDDLKSKVMAEIMAIMGIFASIIFAVFGGLQQIGAIGSSLATTPLHKVFIFSGMSALALTYVVFLAFNSTAKLTGKRLRSCNCTNEEECQKKGLFHKHPTLFIMTWLFASTVGIGAIVLIYKKYLNDPDDFLKKGAVVGILGTVLLIGGGIIIPTVLAPLWRKICTKCKSWKQNKKDKGI